MDKPVAQKIDSKKTSPNHFNLPTEKTGCVSLFDTRVQAEAAVKEMQRAGFDMKKLSLVGRDFQTEESIVGFYNTSDRVKFWGKEGAFWGGLWGLLVGSAFFVIPGVGPLVVAGQFAAAIVSVLEGAVVIGGLSALGAALFSVGIPKNSIVEYESEVKAGKYMMIAHGTSEELHKAREIAQNSGATSVKDFEPKVTVAAETTQRIQ